MKKYLFYSFSAVVVIALIVQVITGPSPMLPQAQASHKQAKEFYKQKEAEFKEAQYQLCLTEKEQAHAKIYDSAIGKYDLLLRGETLAELEKTANKDCEKPGVETKKKTPTVQIKPEDLFYVFLKDDNTYPTQSMQEHFARNGYLATDLGTNQKKLTMYAPSFEFFDGKLRDEAREYTVKVVENYDTMGLTAELHWVEGEDKMNWAIGHANKLYVKDGDIVKTGQEIGLSGGCPGELLYKEKSDGCHVHIELRKNGDPIPYPQYAYSQHHQYLYSKYTDNEEVARVLEGIHQQETGKCMGNCKTSSAGALGPFQFMPKTWEAKHCEGKNNVQNFDDALCAATGYVESILKDKTKDRPELELKWRLWQAACHYNSGYQFICERKELEKAKAYGVIRYADNVIKYAYE